MPKARRKPSKPPTFTIGGVIDVPEAWVRPGEQHRPYAFTVRPSMPKEAPRPAAKEDGPTIEARQHGEYVKGNSGGRAVITNQRPNMLLALRGSGSINDKQCAGGLCFIETYTVVWGSQSRRDSTQPFVGGEAHETESQAERWARANARTNTILNRIGPSAYSQLVSVCVFSEPIGAYRDARDAHEQLRRSLDQCAIVYGVDGA